MSQVVSKNVLKIENNLVFTAGLVDEEEEEEEVFVEGTESSEFDQIIGAIEDIAISDDFQALQNNLLETYCHHFEVTLN